MTGCVAQRKDIYYVKLTYYDKNHYRKEKWISTGLSGRGAKQKATAMIDSMIEKYSYLEKSEHPAKMADYLKMWKELQINDVAETTYDGYHTYIDRHLIPYFKEAKPGHSRHQSRSYHGLHQLSFQGRWQKRQQD